ncbi:tyrosine-type recombinase/integrase [Shewanella sp.]|uniref:tyrosine-type recombinase/integrase n=1 Tax=Shewanella sp. TaxID=50422 RepID=UPI003D0A484B
MRNSPVKTPSYLFRSRHGVWYARIVVSEAMQGILGKRELRKSLATKDRLEAVRKSWRVLAGLRGLAEGNAQDNSEIAQTVVAGHPDTVLREGLTVSRDTIQSSNTPVNLPKLSQVIEEFCQEKLKQGAWAPHSEYVNRHTFKDLIHLVGDVRLDDFTLTKALEYKRYFLSKNELSIVTVNKRLTRVSALLHWASLNYGTSNSMDGLSVKVSARVKASKARDALSDSKIRQLFREIPPTTEYKLPYRAWVPRLAAYTGARLGELAQLYIDDFQVIDNYPCILIRATHSDQSIKTATSERVIPIHPKLIAMGFLKFVDRQRENGHERLFPELRKLSTRGYSHQVSKWFSTFKSKLGWNERDTLYGIRHAVATQLKRKEFSSDMVAGLLGHTHGSITFDRYGKEYEVGNMLKLINALEWT